MQRDETTFGTFCFAKTSYSYSEEALRVFFISFFIIVGTLAVTYFVANYQLRISNPSKKQLRSLVSLSETRNSDNCIMLGIMHFWRQTAEAVASAHTNAQGSDCRDLCSLSFVNETSNTNANFFVKTREGAKLQSNGIIKPSGAR